MLLQNRYQLQPTAELIQNSQRAVVYQAFDQELEQMVVLKCYKDSMISPQALADNHQRLIAMAPHPNLVPCLDYFEWETINAEGEAKTLYVGVWQYQAHRPWKSTQLQAVELKKVFIDVLAGLQHLHRHGIAHYNLSFGNILLSEESEPSISAKLISYGLIDLNDQLQFGDLLPSSFVYKAPEFFDRYRYTRDQKLRLNMDIWSFGMIAYKCCTGKLPFSENLNTTQQITTAVLDMVVPTMGELQQEFWKLVERSLIKDAHNRAQSVDELLGYLEVDSSFRSFQAVVPQTEEQFRARFLFPFADQNASSIAAYDALSSKPVQLEFHAISGGWDQSRVDWWKDLQQSAGQKLHKVAMDQQVYLVVVESTAEKKENTETGKDVNGSPTQGTHTHTEAIRMDAMTQVILDLKKISDTEEEPM